MTKLIQALAEGVAQTALAACALAHRVLRLTGTRPSEMASEYTPKAAMVRHDVPPIE